MARPRPLHRALKPKHRACEAEGITVAYWRHRATAWPPARQAIGGRIGNGVKYCPSKERSRVTFEMAPLPLNGIGDGSRRFAALARYGETCALSGDQHRAYRPASIARRPTVAVSLDIWRQCRKAATNASAQINDNGNRPIGCIRSRVVAHCNASRWRSRTCNNSYYESNASRS